MGIKRKTKSLLFVVGVFFQGIEIIEQMLVRAILRIFWVQGSCGHLLLPRPLVQTVENMRKHLECLVIETGHQEAIHPVVCGVMSLVTSDVPGDDRSHGQRWVSIPVR